MNRLVLIGNGFDLAHGMKTSYYDFIFDYINSAFVKAKKDYHYSDELFDIKYNHRYDRGELLFENMTDFKNHLNDFEKKKVYAGTQYGKEITKTPKIYEWFIKNKFFQKLVLECCDLEWVDIENEYYIALLEILHNTKFDMHAKSASVCELNNVFKFLIIKLGEYFEKIKMHDFNPELLDLFTESINKEEIFRALPESERRLESLMILNFNYTSTHEVYQNWYKQAFNNNTISNYIHGKLKSPLNPIIFGFGDEADDNYKLIENDKSDGFLEYVKTFAYLKTTNYKKLLNFIDLAPYQIHVLGHSCGLSDRTLLKMIFEHENCLSIKIFYHEREDGSNNFTSLTQAISRNFSDNGLMRKKVVDFTLCKALPQLKLK